MLLAGIPAQPSPPTGEHWHFSERATTAQHFIYCPFPMPSSLWEKPGRYHWDNASTPRLGRRTGARLYFRLSAKDSGELVFPAQTPDQPNLHDSRLETMLFGSRFRAGATGSPIRTWLSLISVSGAWPHRVVQVPAMVPEPDPPIGHSSPQRKMTFTLSSHQTGRKLRSYQSARGTLRSGYATAMVRVLSK